MKIKITGQLGRAWIDFLAGEKKKTPKTTGGHRKNSLMLRKADAQYGGKREVEE